MKRILSNVHSIALDTNIFVYYFDRKSSFYLKAEQLFTAIITRNLQITTSTITLMELLSFKASQPMLIRLEQELLSVPNLSMIEMNREIAREAAGIRRKYSFGLPDSIQLATALNQKAQAFITNDQRLKQFKELKIVQLDQL